MNAESTYSFGTDFHGNLHTIDAFLKSSHQAGVDHVIFGGDLTPKKMAVTLADGVAIPYQEMTAGGWAHIQGNKQKWMQDEGYMMLKESPYSIEAIRGMARIAQQLQKLSYEGQREKQPDFTMDDISIIEKYLSQHIFAFLHSSEGQKHLNCFNQHPVLVASGLTFQPQAFIDAYVTLVQFTYLQNNRLLQDQKASSHLFFGHDDASDQEIKRKCLLAYNVARGDVGIVLLASLSAMPWVEWSEQYGQLIQYAPEKQKEFLDALLSRLQSFRQLFRGSISVILGNDDHQSLESTLDEAAQSGLLFHASNRVVQLNADTQMLGYSYVPIIDTGGLYDEWFKGEPAIHSDLLALHKRVRSDVRCIANIHTPPNNSPLAKAVIQNAEGDYGSSGVRKFLEECQPQLALTGHIHRSWAVTGTVHERIGKTAVFNPGDSEYKPRFLIGSVEHTEKYQLIEPNVS